MRHLVCEIGVDPEEVVAQVDRQQPQQLQQLPQHTETDNSSTARGSGFRKQLGFDEIRRTPKRETTPEQQAATSSTTAIGRPGCVAQEVQTHDIKMVVVENVKIYPKTILASTQVGKGQTIVQEQEIQQTNDIDNPWQTNDPWMTARQQLQGQLATSNAAIKQRNVTIKQLQDRLTCIEASIAL